MRRGLLTTLSATLVAAFLTLSPGVASAGSPAPGYLRVYTDPAVPMMILVDGTIRDAFGLNWLPMSAGSHYVCFGPTEGYQPPNCVTVDVASGVTTTVKAVPDRLGYLRVTTSPALPSTVTVDGVAVNDYGAWFATTPGSHTVCWGQVKGYTAPPCISATVAAGITTTAVGTFTTNASAPGPAPGFGYLRVTTSPAVGARVVVDGYPRDAWGLNWLKVPAGSHSVCFDDIAPAAGPNCVAVNVTAGATSTVNGAFQLRGTLRVVTSPAVDATISIDGVAANNYGVWRYDSTGGHTVCFGAVAGYKTPACQTVNLTTSGLTVTGEYQPA